MICAVAAGPNVIPVSPEWENQLLNSVEGTNTSEKDAETTQSEK
ncbi:hypothetical protein ETH_00001105 [Eimeria tenella]|uniref:Uncharacterized protein n=1 Tax=Eimeria tenella TaxID=5802 RepID=U6KR56_EIMTE|nr:hypothetical protein ETH_00001105 [Eimeria tenella]CDJ37908.1 hypothetical protein ETH_00001105 [Eimeria tenella]|eukprot:XP_013228746.1 hypothetical protein ETH_00001105 [Eimeria tenella]